MQYTGFIKRFLPFVATFAAGLFIASFFVTIGLPKFGSRHRERRHNEVRALRVEVEQLRKEKCDLRRQLEGMKSEAPKLDTPVNLEGDIEFSVPVPPPVAAAPAAPAAPHRHR